MKILWLSPARLCRWSAFVPALVLIHFGNLNADEHEPDSAYAPPDGYYDPEEGLLGEPLKEALHDIIDGQVVIGYFDKIPVLFSVVDQDPDNPNNILLLYSGDSVPASSSSWNREHTWPRSYGADDGPAFSDAHHLFPADATANSDRSNYAFDNLETFVPMADAPESRVNDSLRMVEPRDADKGRIARAIFYMETRYDSSNVTGNFTLSDFPRSFSNRLGRLSALLEWNRKFPPDERERRRNHLIYTGIRADNAVVFQANRNPFVDYPQLVDAVHTADVFISWGSWSVEQFTFAQLDEPEVSGPLGDPDEDAIPNFAEFALQTDPRDPVNADLPLTERDADGNFFQFMRLPEAETSFISYGVEVSRNPLEALSWTPIPFSDRDLLRSPRGMAEWVSLPHQPQADDRPSFYRLRVDYVPPGGESESFFYDPAAADAGGEHLFTYTLSFENGWHLSDWFGYLLPNDAPWFYHLEHKWIHTTSESETDVWFVDSVLGWCYTNRESYPYLYVAALDEWLFYVRGSESPERWFFQPSLDDYVRESDLL